MRILQLIDSLEPGGAERMAVNYANILSEKIDFSGLVATRNEGALKNQLDKKVNYSFINKKTNYDFKSFWKLIKIIKSHNVNIIHAHSSSFFWASLLKIAFPSLKIVWHDHYGNSDFLEKRPIFFLKFCSVLFSYIVSVNEKLYQWSKLNLYCKKVTFLPNFVFFDKTSSNETILKGIENKRIVCLANLRTQKNHSLLLNVALLLKQSNPDWTFHFIGKDFEDAYSKSIKDQIVELKLNKVVFLYGSRNDISNILSQSNIGVLSSSSEGLPVSLLEYGYNNLPVISTNVGDVSTVLTSDKNGILVDSNNITLFHEGLCKLIDNPDLAISLAKNLNKFVNEKYTAENCIELYFSFLRS